MSSARKRLRLSHAAPPPHATGGETTDEDEEFLLVEEDTTDSGLIITMDGSRVKTRRKRRRQTEAQEGGASESEPEIDRQLDQSLETKSKQHNLTTANVKTLLHEVITNEHVVAMMKAAINDTEAPPPFEVKMTRSKLKEVTERGVVIPAWNLSPIKTNNDNNKPPQFVDMALADEDSSDEEYRPDEDEDDETEDTFQESDLESSASSPRGSRVRDESSSPWQTSRSLTRRLRAEPVPMGPPPPPKAVRSLSDSPRAPPLQGLTDGPRAPPPRGLIDRCSDSTFLKELHEVEEELNIWGQSYHDSQEDLMAWRTRSKRPLRDVPLGQLEAELRDPALDLNETRSSLDPDQDPDLEEDRDWTDWLRGLMTSDVEEEVDDEDDPEYNFLADADEPDLEDYRDDRAVRITKKEVSELMEELFETLKDDVVSQDVDEEETADTTVQPTLSSEVQVPVLRTVREQLDFLKKNVKQTKSTKTQSPDPPSLSLNPDQKSRLTHQVQQHVQLLAQVHLLCAPVSELQEQSRTTAHLLVELDFLGQGAELMMSSRGFHGNSSAFRVCNLQGALDLLDEIRVEPVQYQRPRPRANHRGHVKSYPLMPAGVAWLFITRSVFIYPELLPCASLDPAWYCPRRSHAFTAAEDCLLVLALRTFSGTLDELRWTSELLLRKSPSQIRRRLLQCCRPGNSHNVVKSFRCDRRVRSMPKACLPQGEVRPPVERDERCLPLWVSRSLPVLHDVVRRLNSEAPPSVMRRPRCSQLSFLRSDWSGPFPAGTRFPPRLPQHELKFHRLGFSLTHTPPEATPTETPPTQTTLHKAPPPKAPPTEQQEAGTLRSEEEAGSESDIESVSSNEDPECDTGHAPLQRLGAGTGSDISEGREEEVMRAKNVCVTPCGKRVWTREEDRELLLAVQKEGADQKTFRVVSSRLQDKTPTQVALRFRDLMTLFHSSNHRTASAQEPIRRQKAPD